MYRNLGLIQNAIVQYVPQYSSAYTEYNRKLSSSTSDYIMDTTERQRQ
jgi:hypothetical protein